MIHYAAWYTPALASLSKFSPKITNMAKASVDAVAGLPAMEHLAPMVANAAGSLSMGGISIPEAIHAAKPLRPYLSYAKNMVVDKAKNYGTLTRSALKPPAGTPLWR